MEVNNEEFEPVASTKTGNSYDGDPILNKYRDSQHASAYSNLQREILKDRIKKLKHDTMDQINSHVKELFDDFTRDFEATTQKSAANGGRQASMMKKKTGELLDKVFVERRSVLSDMLEINHIQTIYHIFTATLLVFSIHTIVYDIIDRGQLVLDLDMLMWVFGKFPTVMWVWSLMSLSTMLVVYPAFLYWTTSRPAGGPCQYDYVALALYIVYLLAFLVLPVRSLLHHSLPPASSVVITCEQIRLLMKTHAFVRENIPKVFQNSHKNDDESTSSPCPPFSKYLYFLFAPTLIYRDTYPRTRGPVRWRYVVSNFAQVLACLFYVYYIFMRFCIPVFRDFSQEHWLPKRLLLTVFGCMMPGTLVLLLAFFAILHSWLNAFAEMLRFGDRLFYKDWWNCSSYSEYYRTWNIVVHDWLYTYVYKDIYRVIGHRHRTKAMASVFLLSAMFHEYVLCLAFGYFYPVLFIFFAGVGFAFIFVPRSNQRTGNIFMWLSLFHGNGLLFCLYSMEWYARQRCPDQYGIIYDYVVPRSWFCNVSPS